MSEPFDIIVSEEDPEGRLDAFLATRLGGISRSRIQKMIALGHITVNDVSVAGKTTVHSGDRIHANIEEALPWSILPEPIELDVIFEDSHLAIINKQRDLAVHPGAGRPAGTLVNALAHRYKTLPGGSSPERPGIVHRLDKDTSGLMVVALSEEAMPILSRMIADRKVSRNYLALVWGNPRFAQATVSAAIGRDPRHPDRMAVLPEIGPDKSKKAETELNVVDRFEGAALIGAALKTGRTHQIRVHCAYAGHEIVGDFIYGKRRDLPPSFSPAQKVRFKELLDVLDGQALHAWKLEFAHPITGEELSFHVDPPAAMTDLVEFFRKGDNP